MLFDSLRTASKLTRRVLVSYSGGKDSAATLHLCQKYFDEVRVFYMYLVQGLSFVERHLASVEARYQIEVIRVPHFMLSEWLRYGTFRAPDMDVPIVSVRQVYDYVREETGIYWVAGGERISDSYVRRAMIKKSGSIDKSRGRIYPLAAWRKSHVLDYLKFHKIKCSSESAKLGFSFRSLMPRDMAIIKSVYPGDYETIRSWFPMVEATVKRHEYFGQAQ